MAENRLTGNFNLKADGIPNKDLPYNDWNIINIQNERVGGWLHTLITQGARAINFQYILKNGDVPQFYSDTIDEKNKEVSFVKSPYIDWTAKDEFTRALETIKTESQKRIQADSALTALLAKDTWTREDRVAWEKKISQIVSEERHKIPGLDKYRTEKKDNGVVKHRRLNDVSPDIENNATMVEFDCKNMSVVDGVLLQRLENDLLPVQAPQDDYKKASHYFYVSGYSSSASDREAYAHAFVLSPMGNIIEATSQVASYKESLVPDYTFDDFVTGKIVPFGESHEYYGGDPEFPNGISAKNIQKAEIEWKALVLERTGVALIHAEEQTQRFLKNVKALGDVEDIKLLKEYVKAAKSQHPPDLHLLRMIKEIMSHPDTQEALHALFKDQVSVTNDWEAAVKLADNDPSVQQKIKAALEQYNAQIKNEINDIPVLVGGGAFKTFGDVLSLWALPTPDVSRVPQSPQEKTLSVINSTPFAP